MAPSRRSSAKNSGPRILARTSRSKRRNRSLSGRLYAGFFPVSGRQNIARGQDFDAEDMSLLVDVVNEWTGLFRPVDSAVPHGDVHRVGLGIVGDVGHGFGVPDNDKSLSGV